MDKRADRTVALLSIHPMYANRLLNGSKRVELRKTKLYEDVKYIMIYSTSPIQKIVGYFSIAQIVIDSPSVIWSKYQETAGIERIDFFSYYETSKNAVAIEVSQMYPLNEAVPLSVLGQNIKPPQSFQYFNYSAIELLTSHSSVFAIA